MVCTICTRRPRKRALFCWSPSQSQGACAPCASSPAGGAKCTCVHHSKLHGKVKLQKHRITAKFFSIHGRVLGSPSEIGRASCRERAWLPEVHGTYTK